MGANITPEALERAQVAYSRALTGPGSHVRGLEAAILAALPELLAAQPASTAGGQEPVATCRCGAPCRKVILERGGDNGWGDDDSRTVLRYAAPVAGEAAQGITPEWVLGYFDTDLPERARDAVRHAFAEYAALASAPPAPAAVPAGGELATVIRDALARAIGCGYAQGHRDTEEGDYVEVRYEDRIKFHGELADDLLTGDRDFASIAALAAQPGPAAQGVDLAPDTFFLIDCPGWPGGLPMGAMHAALDYVRRFGDAKTRISTWKEQAGRRDYSPEEVRAMLDSQQHQQREGGA